MAVVQFGLIACSRVARRRFLPALQGVDCARLAHVGSRDAAKAAGYAEEFSSPKFGDYTAVLADPDLDAVYISTPPTLHAEWVQQAAAAGKHVLCEKPAFTTGMEARAAVAACRANGVRLLEGYAFKYHPQHARVRALIAEGKIGTPRFFSAEVVYPRPPDGDIRLQSELAGGVLHDSAGYPVAAAMMQLGAAPISVSCELSRDAVSGVDDAVAITLRFPKGEVAQLYAAFGGSYRSRYTIAGTLGRIEVERAFAVPTDQSVVINVETAAGVEKITLAPADQFGLMIAEFCATLGGGPVSANPYEQELLQLQTVMDAVAESARQQRTLNLSTL